MLPVLGETKRLPAGYRPAGGQTIRVDLAEKILRAAFDARAKATDKTSKERHPRFRLDLALPISIGLEEENARRLLGSAGFRLQRARALVEGAHGPAAPDSWTWRPRRAGERPERGRRPENRKGKGGPKAKGGKPNAKRNQGDRHHNKPREKKPDTGPARARGAFDGLADLLGG